MKKWQSQAGYWSVFSIQTVHLLTGCKRDGLCITTQVLNFLPSQANVRTKQGFSVSVPLKYHHGCLKCHFLIDLGPSRNNLFHFQGFHKNKCPLSLLYILYPPTSPTLATFLIYWEFTKQLSVLNGCNSNSLFMLYSLVAYFVISYHVPKMARAALLSCDHHGGRRAGIICIMAARR